MDELDVDDEKEGRLIMAATQSTFEFFFFVVAGAVVEVGNLGEAGNSFGERLVVEDEKEDRTESDVFHIIIDDEW